MNGEGFAYFRWQEMRMKCLWLGRCDLCRGIWNLRQKRHRQRLLRQIDADYSSLLAKFPFQKRRSPSPKAEA